MPYSCSDAWTNQTPAAQRHHHFHMGILFPGIHGYPHHRPQDARSTGITLALSLGRHSVMEAGAGLTKTGPLGNRSPRTPLFDGTPSFPDSRCLPYWAKQTARRQPFVLYAGVMTTSNHNVPWHTSTHSPPEPRLRSDKPATGQLVGQKTFASLGIRGRAFSRILVHTGMFA